MSGSPEAICHDIAVFVRSHGRYALQFCSGKLTQRMVSGLAAHCLGLSDESTANASHHIAKAIREHVGHSNKIDLPDLAGILNLFLGRQPHNLLLETHIVSVFKEIVASHPISNSTRTMTTNASVLVAEALAGPAVPTEDKARAPQAIVPAPHAPAPSDPFSVAIAMQEEIEYKDSALELALAKVATKQRENQHLWRRYNNL